MAKQAKKTSTAKPKAKATAKKAAAKKPTAKTKSQAGTIKMLAAKPSTRRPPSNPPSNPDMPQKTIDDLNAELTNLRNILDDYSQHLRALDRKRLNGVGIKKLGFIERAYEFALENAEFLPHYLTIERFGNDLQYFLASAVSLT